MNSLVFHSIITSTWKPGRPLREDNFPPFPQHFLTSPNSLLACFLFFYLSPACFVLHNITCKWIHCLRWQNLSHSQEWWSTPSGMMGGEREVQHIQFIHLYLSIGIFVPLLACARLTLWACSHLRWRGSLFIIIGNGSISLTCCVLEV